MTSHSISWPSFSRAAVCASDCRAAGNPVREFKDVYYEEMTIRDIVGKLVTIYPQNQRPLSIALLVTLPTPAAKNALTSNRNSLPVLDAILCTASAWIPQIWGKTKYVRLHDSDGAVRKLHGGLCVQS
jgi:hypothetical protein